MAALIIGILSVVLWTGGLSSWIVQYATGITQFGIWVTALSLVPFSALWVSLKTTPFSTISTQTTRAHWSLFLK